MADNPMSPTQLQLTVAAANFLRAAGILCRAIADDIMSEVPKASQEEPH